MKQKEECKVEASLILNEFVPYRINVLAGKISRSLAIVYKRDFGLSIYEWRVLAVLGSHASLSASELAEKTNMDRVRLSRTASDLYDDGLVLRKISSCDRRKTFFKISKKGLILYEEIVPLALRWQEVLFSSFSKKELEVLSNMLTELEFRLACQDLENVNKA